MPASHSATTEIPRSSPRLCQRLVDVHTRCNAPIARKHVCKAHIQAYEESHERYKDAANDARALSASARLKRSEVGQLGRAEVEDRIVDIGAYIDALEREKLLRKEHDWTFVGEPDEGHRTRLQKIEQQLEHSRDIIHMLRSRRGRLERNSRGQPCRARSAILPEQPPASEAGSSSRSPRHRNRRRGDEERGAQSRAAARKRLSKERERQHVVVIEANRTRELIEEESFQNHIRSALAKSEVEVRASNVEMPNASLDPPGSSQAGSQLESEEVGEERGGAEDKDTCPPVHALHHLPSLQHIPDRSTEPPSADEHREQQVSAVSGPKDLVQTRRMTMPPLLAQTGASLLDGGSPVSPQDRSQDAPAVEEPAEDTCNELHIEIIDLQTAVHREDDIGVGASDVDVGQTIAAEPVTAGTAPDDLVASSADPGSPFIKSAMASIRTTGEEGREGPGICRTTVGGPDVSLASIEAHTGTPNYGACPWNSDLERQGTGDDDASRPTRRLRREVVRRIACLVLGLLIGGVLSRPGTVSKSWRILRKLCARAASRTLTRRLYWQP